MHEPHMDIHVNAVLYVSFYLFSQGIYGIAGAQCAAQTGQVSARRVQRPSLITDLDQAVLYLKCYSMADSLKWFGHCINFLLIVAKHLGN